MFETFVQFPDSPYCKNYKNKHYFFALKIGAKALSLRPLEQLDILQRLLLLFQSWFAKRLNKSVMFFL